MALENFAINTLIIPMDTTYQDNGMYKAYGLVWNLLFNGIPVKWSIQPGKPFDGTDFTATAQDIVTLTPIINHNYTGGPFIIDSAFAAAAIPLITAWNLINIPVVVVHRATQAFQAEITATLNRAPRITVEETNYGIIRDYLNLASIPNPDGNTWAGSAGSEPYAFDPDEVGQGAFFGFSKLPCRRIAYDIFISPHTGSGTWTDPVNAAELDDYLKFGGMLHSTCFSIIAIENVAGPFLTTTGIPTTDTNGGDTSTFTVAIPDFPVAQAVSTGLPQGLPGGSEQTWRNNLTSYYPTTSVLAYFTEDNLQYDFMIVGPYKGGTGAGKIVYEGGHDYDPRVPYTSRMSNLYYRFVLDSVFFSVTKPLMYLNSSPQQLFQGVENTITFDVVNSGASTANSADFTVTLSTGVIYNGDATITPTSIIGQTLTWSSLGNVPSGTIITFTAEYTPIVLGDQQLADFSSSFEDNYAESYSLDHCTSAQIVQFDRADLESIKTVDLQFAQPGDDLTYTITITNNGILPSINNFFQDTPQGVSFSSGSVIINGIPYPALDPTVGFYIPDPANQLTPIAPAGIVTVVFTAEVEVVPVPPQAINQAFIDYSFDNGGIIYDATSITNEVITEIDQGELTLTKAVDKAFATIGDIVTYTVDVTNTGTVIANNVIFTDTPPTGSSFVVGSFKIGGVPQPGASPIVGVNLGSIAVGATVTVSFDVLVNSIPDPPVLNNVSNATFIYKIDPVGPNFNGFSTSNRVLTQLSLASITAAKSADKQYVEVGDKLVYTTVITNTGTVPATNVIFTDTPPVGTTFVPGSFRINGVPQPGANPIIGVNLGTIPQGGSVTVSFEVTVDVLPPPPSQIINTSTVNFQYKIDPNGPTENGVVDSPPVTTDVELAKLDLVKSADKAYVEVGDILTYTVVITNTGTVTADNVIFKDTPPAGTTFVPGSFKRNGLPFPGNPSVGINIGSIAPGASVTVSFEVTVDSLPLSGQITNTAFADYEFKIDPQGPTETRTDQSNPITTDVEVASLSLVKTQSKNFAEVGETLTYTVVVTNTGTVTANNVIFKDTPPLGTSYIAGTFKKNGIIQPGANPSIGVNLGSIAPGAFVTVTFDVKIDSLPPSGQIINSASADFEFKIDPNGPTEIRTELSNTVTAEVETAALDMVKSVDKSFVQVGDTANYSVIITNTGTVSADNVIFNDTPPAGTSFIPGTFKIGGVPQLGANPIIGVNLGSIPAGGSVTVSFDVSIDSLPPSGQIINTATATFQYKVDPNGPSRPGTSQSNPVTSEVELVEINVVKSADKAFVKVGDTLTYEFTITNTGTVAANNVTFSDTPPAGTTFIPNSFKIEGVPQPGANPTIGINLGSLAPGASVNVSFDVTIDVLPPPPSEITNTASVNFEYQVDPNGPILTETTPSNPYTAKVEEVNVSMVKTVNKAFAEVGETLTYTVVVTNSGTIAANNVIFKDEDPEGASFIAGSFKINGSVQGAADPNVGVNIGTIPAGGSVTVSYNATVNSVPPSGQIKNTALATFEYKVDPNGPTETEDISSNEVITEAELGKLKVEKTVDKAYVEVGDTLTYTVNITNIGTVTSSNVKFTDVAPTGTSFISGSFKINGIPQIASDPSLGVNLGSIAPGVNVIVSFDVTVNSIPLGGLIVNAAEVTFEYKVDPSGPVKTATVPSNEVESKAEIAELELTKSSNKEYVEVGSTLTYTTVIKNTGTVVANNVVFKDIPPVNTTFVPNSLKVNGVTQIGANPSVGVNVGSIAPGNSVIVSYSVTVDSLPIPPELINTASATFEFKIDPNGPTITRTTESNRVINPVVLVKLDVIKETDKTVATVGDIINYSISVINTGTVTAQNVIIKDVVPAGTTFALGSLTVNGISKPEANPNAGVEIGNIAPGGFVIITFSVKVESIPDPPQAINVAVVDFKVQIDPNGPIEDRTSESNEVITELKVVELKAVKKVDKTTAEIGDELTYTIVITNTGTVTATEVKFTDNIPEGTEFVVNSLTINGVQKPGVRPWDDVLLGTIQPGESVTVTFKVKVTFIPCPPKLINIAIIKFKYQLEVGGVTSSIITESNEAVTYVGIKIFKQISVDENLTIPEVKPDVEEILEVIADVEITYTNVIKTPIVTSYEGQQLTGWKLIVEGKIRQKIVYIADELAQPVHAAEFDVPFSTFLVLPKDLKECQMIKVEGIIEDIFVKLVDKRTIFKNVTLMIEGKASC